MNTDDILWRRADPGEPINANEVHVWRVLLDLSLAEIESLRRILSAEELTRAGRFHFEQDQNRFIAARGMLRKILGQCLGMNPQELYFVYTSYGKPVLAPDRGGDPLCFNLSHSGAFALIAITHGRNLGVDIEQVRNDVAVGLIAQRFFSPGEISSLEKIQDNERPALFFQYWTRKEAFIKARGEGLSFPMEQCDVSFMSGTVLSPVILPGTQSEGSGWYVQDLFPGTGYAAAIAVEGGDWELSCREYAF